MLIVSILILIVLVILTVVVYIGTTLISAMLDKLVDIIKGMEE